LNNKLTKADSIKELEWIGKKY